MFVFIREQNQEDFWNTIKSMNYSWIILSWIFGLFSHLIRAHRWKYLLEPIGHMTRFSNRYHATMIGYLVNMVLPRSGEASRAGVLLKTEQVPFSKAFGTIIVERIIDVLMLGLVILVTILLSIQDFRVLYNKLLPEREANRFSFNILYLTLVVLVLLILIFILRRNKTLRAKIWNFLNELKSGVFSILKSKNPVSFVLNSILIWVLYIAYFGICFFALEEASKVSLQGVLMAFIAGTVGIMLTPGGLGSYPIFVGTVISYYAYPDLAGIQNDALALAMVIWLTQTIFIISLGMISLFYISRNFSLKDENNA
jgi:uncharacterized protein (TIRG00374 family)